MVMLLVGFFKECFLLGLLVFSEGFVCRGVFFEIRLGFRVFYLLLFDYFIKGVLLLLCYRKNKYRLIFF